MGDNIQVTRDGRQRLLVVDGHNLLFQMFFGMPSRITGRDGRAIHGTLGFVGALLKIIRMTQPTHIVALFDGEKGSPRSSLDEQYKANRPDYTEVPDDVNPFSQLGDIYSALDYMQIKHAEAEDCEADDVMAAYARAYSGDMEVIIASFDSDMFQLAGDSVSILRYRGEHSVLCGPNYIMSRFGVTPGQYADFKALVGDASDNIKGVPGIGPKTAAGLLNLFGSLDNILQNAGRIERISVRRSILESAGRLALNRELIRLDGSAALPFPVGDLGLRCDGMTTNEVLSGIGLR